MVIIEALTLAWFWFLSLALWLEILIGFSLFYAGFATWRIIDYADGELKNIHYGIRDAFFPKSRKYFVFYDIFRMIFFLPGIALAVFILLLKAGALEFIPFFKRIFGFKLFKIRKTIEDFPPGSQVLFWWNGRQFEGSVVGGVSAGKEYRHMLPSETSKVGGSYSTFEDRLLVYRFNLHEEYDYVFLDPENVILIKS